MRTAFMIVLIIAIVAIAIFGVAVAKPNCDNPNVAAHNKHCESAPPCDLGGLEDIPVLGPILCMLAGMG